jgi:hypothetical protein
VLAPLYPLSTLSISSVSRCPGTGVFRVVFDAGDVEVSADLTVCWLEEQNCAWLRFVLVDRIRTRDAALASAVEAWVRDNERAVFEAALSAEAA